MPKVIPVFIPRATTLEDLRISVADHLNRLSLKIAQLDSRTSPLSLSNFRITDLADPADGRDAVNLKTLRDAVTAGAGSGMSGSPGTVLPSLTVGSFGGQLYPVDILGSAKSQIHVSSSPADTGGWITTILGTGTYLSYGASFNGSLWVAKATTAVIIGCLAATTISFYADTGLSISSTFTPTLRFSMASNGDVDLATGIYKNLGLSGISGIAPLAKLTAGGSNGTLTLTGGIITNKINPT